MMIEMKFGRPCIAWEEGVGAVKGRYLIYQSHGQAHWILCDDGTITPFKHAEPDLNADPMNGDEVIFRIGHASAWSVKTAVYAGRLPISHIVHTGMGNIIEVKEVRHPQQSKREELEKLLDRYSCYKSFDSKCLADQIDKIYTEDL